MATPPATNLLSGQAPGTQVPLPGPPTTRPSPEGALAFGLTLTPSATPGLSIQGSSHSVSPPAPPEKPGAMTALSRAQNLPALVLETIVDCLPLGAQFHCAQVCRHWHDCLPLSEVRLSRWLQKNAPLSCLANPELGQAFKNRTLPFLQAASSPVVPALAWLLQQQELADHRLAHTCPPSQQPLHASTSLAAGLVHYGLNLALMQARQFSLRPADIDCPDSPVSEFHLFSRCGRWLVTTCSFAANTSSLLRCYGWEQGAWHRQILVTDTLRPVKTCKFTSTPPDTLISVHSLDMLVWRRAAGTCHWHPCPLYRLTWPYNVHRLCPMHNGDLVITARSAQPQRNFQLLFFLYSAADRSWKAPLKYVCDGQLRAYTHDWRSCQLALSLSTQRQRPGHRINEVHIWRKGLNTDSPEQWGCRVSQLTCQDTDIAKLRYSPGGHYLLGVLSNGRTCLWELDAQQQLQERLTLACCPLLPTLNIHSLTLFNSDATQLALPCSLEHIQLFYRDSKGHWQRGQQLQAPPVPEVPPDEQPPDDALNSLQLSSSGRTLVRTTLCRMDIWHRNPGGQWQHLVQRLNHEDAQFAPVVCMADPGELIYTTAQDPELSLQVYGPDRQGQLVRKVCMAVTSPVASPGAVTADGLSLLLGSTEVPPTLLQLSFPADSEADSQTADCINAGASTRPQ